MIGTLQKTISPDVLACSKCAHFRSDDPDLFYCEENKKEFPLLCGSFKDRNEIFTACTLLPVTESTGKFQHGPH